MRTHASVNARKRGEVAALEIGGGVNLSPSPVIIPWAPRGYLLSLCALSWGMSGDVFGEGRPPVVVFGCGIMF